MIFPKDFPDKLRSSILISEIVEKKVQLKQRGGFEFTGLCPFHNEKTPSFTINNQKGFYYCFGCQAHGDIISFVMNSDGLTYKEAVVKIAQDYGIEIPKVKKDEDAFLNKRQRYFLLLEKAKIFFQKNLNLDIARNAKIYLNNRGFDNNAIQNFSIGFAKPDGNSLVEFLRLESFSNEEIASSGIINKNDNGVLYDKFRNRIMFPIFNRNGEVVAFGGRSLKDEIPKYLNSSETEFFKKNQTLYNLSIAKKSIFKEGYVIIVEGYLDVISLSINGIENVVAGLGTAIGNGHIQELFNITNKIVICLDGDNAGFRAMKRCLDICLPIITSEKNISFAFLPNNMDPDDFVKNFGTQSLKKIITNSTPLSKAMFEFALIDANINSSVVTAEKKALLELILNKKINQINDKSLKKHFLSFVKDSVFFLGKKRSTNQKTFQSNQKFIEPSIKNIVDIYAKNIIAILIFFPELSSFRNDIFDIREIQFDSDELTNLKDFIIEKIDNLSHENNQNNTYQNILNSLSELEFAKFIKELDNLVAKIKNLNVDFAKISLHILLLKILLLQVESQYKETLSRAEEIETHQSEIINQKIKEIFNYKNSLQQMIYELEKQTI